MFTAPMHFQCGNPPAIAETLNRLNRGLINHTTEMDTSITLVVFLVTGTATYTNEDTKTSGISYRVAYKGRSLWITLTDHGTAIVGKGKDKSNHFTQLECSQSYLKQCEVVAKKNENGQFLKLLPALDLNRADF